MDNQTSKQLEINFGFTSEDSNTDYSCYDFTPSQQRAFDMFLQGKNMFITGEGGAGKSYLTRSIIDYCKKTKKNTIICAPTGVAAQNIGGATLHSTFRMDTKIQMPDKRCKDKDKLFVLKLADVVIIDEISMCRLDSFNFVCNTLRSFKKVPQVIVVGDFFQLPPILTSRNNEFEVWQSIEEYKDKLFPFESHHWKEMDFQTFELTEQVRQSEADYIKCLNDIRMGVPNFSCFKQNDTLDENAITLCTINKTANDINSNKLYDLIDGGAKHKTYESREKGEVGEGNRQTEKELTLCIGARVVFLVNDNTDKMYNNGEMGTVIDLKNDSVIVRSDSGHEITLSRYEWEIKKHVADYDENGNVIIGTKKIGSFEQFPVRLAWAITVHKAQGQTYDNVNIIPDNFFAEGQMYVALSRCRTKEGMHIVGTLVPWRLKCNQRVKDFMLNANR